MNITYHKILDIEVTNNYFQEGICSVFELIPFEDTSRTLKNYDILIHKKLNIFSFYIGTSGERNFDIANELSNIDLLHFQLIVEDDLFKNYTDVPNLEERQIFHFENLENSNVLQKGSFVSKEDILELPEQELQFDNCLGILTLDIKQIVSKPQEAFNLTLDFEARKAYWQYEVVIPNTWNTEDLKLEIQGITDQIYRGPVAKKIVGGQNAMVFTSDQPESLQQNLPKNPLLHVSYSSNLSSRKNDLEIKLPNPGIENLYKLNPEEKDQSFCSTIIVYV